MIFFDGSCEPTNPGGNVGTGTIIYETTKLLVSDGPNGAAIVFDTCKNINKISKLYNPQDPIFQPLGTTNNVAEHLALMNGLKWCYWRVFANSSEDKFDKIVCIGDSQLVINQMNGKFQISDGKAYSRFAFANMEWLARYDDIQVEFYWVPREINRKADMLSKEAKTYEPYSAGILA